MRYAALSLLILSTTAHADVFQNRVHQRDRSFAAGGPQISNVLYLNPCLPNGCALQPGFDDSRTNHSSIAFGATTLGAWPHGDALWGELVACVRDTFRPFQIDVVTTDPGTAAHSEVMIAGTFAQLNPQLEGAGGVAPFVGCGATEDNVISFVFAQQTSDLFYLCAAVAQEAAHVWGLDHELHPLDPMTYLDLGSRKRFQNVAADCGEALANPRECACGDTQQNSYAYLEAVFGGAQLPAATVSFTSPTDGAWVRPGFPVHVAVDSVLGASQASLAIDGQHIATVNQPFAFNAPASITGGAHQLTATGTDGGNRSVSTSITVNVTPACSAAAPCAEGVYCLGGYCIPGAEVPGGLGAECLGNQACVSGLCASGNGQQLCVAPCDDDRTCPTGYSCTGPDESPVCWPAESGGCASTQAASPLLGLALLALRRRRRATLRG